MSQPSSELKQRRTAAATKSAAPSATSPSNLSLRTEPKSRQPEAVRRRNPVAFVLVVIALAAVAVYGWRRYQQHVADSTPDVEVDPRNAFRSRALVNVTGPPTLLELDVKTIQGDPNVFQDEWMPRNSPIMLKNLIDDSYKWVCRKWSDIRMRSFFGRELVVVESNVDRNITSSTLAEYFKLIEADAKLPAEERRDYAIIAVEDIVPFINKGVSQPSVSRGLYMMSWDLMYARADQQRREFVMRPYAHFIGAVFGEVTVTMIPFDISGWFFPQWNCYDTRWTVPADFDFDHPETIDFDGKYQHGRELFQEAGAGPDAPLSSKLFYDRYTVTVTVSAHDMLYIPAAWWFRYETRGRTLLTTTSFKPKDRNIVNLVKFVWTSMPCVPPRDKAYYWMSDLRLNRKFVPDYDENRNLQPMMQ